MGVIVQVLSLPVDQAVRQHKAPHAQLHGCHILCHIVAHHQAVFRGNPDPSQNLPVVFRIGLAEADVFIGCNPLKILRIQARPANPAPGGNGGKQGIGGQHQPKSQFLCPADGLRRLGIEAADGSGILELVGVKRFKNRLVPIDPLSENPCELLPENRLVGLAAVVGHHGRRACPDRVHQCLCLIAVGRQRLCQQAKVGFYKHIVVHGQQGAVQIKQDCCQCHVSSSFRDEYIFPATPRICT